MRKGLYLIAALSIMSLLVVPRSLFSAAFPEFNPNKFVAPSQSKPFVESKALQIDPSYGQPLPEVPERLVEKRMNLTLSDLIDAALEMNPTTRQAWMTAKASAADWAVSRGTYYPKINDTATAIGGHTPIIYNQQSYLMNSLSLNYLLFDFGHRKANAEAAKQALINSNLIYNQTVLDMLRDVPRAYYLLIGTKALVDADEKSLAEARVSLQAAEQRRIAGVGTIADVLQAKANESQAMLTLASDTGQVSVAKGNLATAVGWPANTEYEIVGDITKAPIGKMGESIEELIDAALKNRPDLVAVVAKVKQREAEVRKAQALHAPRLYGTANLDNFKSRNYENAAYYGGVNLQIPIFEGFSIVNQVRSAKAKLAAANESLKITKEQVVTETWNSNFDFLTSLKQIEAATALLESATKSYEVSLGRYKAGAGDIVELMTVQSQLFSARSQYINAKTNVHVNYAQLIHAIGTGFQNPLEVIDIEMDNGASK